MTPFTLVQSLLEAHYKLGTTQINAPEEFDAFLIDWGQLNIPDDALAIEEDGGGGREQEMHITVKYGLKISEVSQELRAVAEATRPFTVLLENVSLFTTNPKHDVVKLAVRSPELHELNARVAEVVPHEDTYPTYNPHVTLAYVQKGTCDHLEGDNPFKDGTPREFMVSGMQFRAAGESDDPERNEEILLFTRKPKDVPDEVLAMAEAVVGAPVVQMDLIKDEIENAIRDSNGNLPVFLELANQALAPHGIRFQRHPENTVGAPAMATEHGAFINPPSAYDLRDPRWPERITYILHHELVHGKQMSRMGGAAAKVRKQATAWVAPGGRMDQDRYLQQKQEIMAWAASMVESWRRQGLTSEQMMRRLRSGNWDFGMKYWHARNRFPQAFNRFVKQATEYIEQLGESAFEEIEADPFAGVSFPVDQDRVQQFLRNTQRRRGEREIL